MSPDFNGWLCYPVCVIIGIVTQLNLVQKSAETSIPFWELLDLIVELILKMVNGNEKNVAMTAAKEYLPVFTQGRELVHVLRKVMTSLRWESVAFRFAANC